MYRFKWISLMQWVMPLLNAVKKKTRFSSGCAISPYDWVGGVVVVSHRSPSSNNTDYFIATALGYIPELDESQDIK